MFIFFSNTILKCNYPSLLIVLSLFRVVKLDKNIQNTLTRYIGKRFYGMSLILLLHVVVLLYQFLKNTLKDKISPNKLFVKREGIEPSLFTAYHPDTKTSGVLTYGSINPPRL